MYKGVMTYTPNTNIIRTDTEKMQFSSGLERWADIKNMQEASRIINILTKYKIENNEHLESVALTDYAVYIQLVNRLSHCIDYEED